jgi:HEAT repeat protein
VQILQSNRGGQLAIARALAAISWPDPSFIDPLFALVDHGDRPRVSAAADALTQYQSNSDVVSHLIKLADADRADDLRIPVILAIGSFNQKSAAQKLISIQQGSSDALQRAAGDALLDMTGLIENSHDVALWKAWWDRVGKDSDREFQDEINRDRAQNFERLVIRRRQMQEDFGGLIGDLYTHIPAAERPQILIRYMQSSTPAIRVIGATLVFESRDTPDGASNEAMREVRMLLDDPSSEVRAASAQALFNIQDSAAAMIAQLGREPDEMVRATLIHSLAPLRDPTAIALLITFIGTDTSVSVQSEAVDAIRQGAEIVANNAELRRKAILALQPIAQKPAQPGRAALRLAAVEALAALRDVGLLPVFQDLIKPEQPLDIRRAALNGLGNLKDPNLGDQLAGYLSDTSPQIRAAALEAFGTVPHPLYIQQVIDRLSDTDDNVKSTAWQVLQSWMAEISEGDLAFMADGLKVLGDQPKRLTALLELRDRLVKDIPNATTNQQRDQKASDLAVQQQTIGDVMMQVQRPADAAEQYKAALGYWKTHNGAQGTLDTLSGNVAQALLAAKKWPEAASFAEGSIKSPYEETVSHEFKAAADNLLNRMTNDPSAYTDAQALFAALDKMNPPLSPLTRDQLDNVRKEIEKKHANPGAP